MMAKPAVRPKGRAISCGLILMVICTHGKEAAAQDCAATGLTNITRFNRRAFRLTGPVAKILM